VGDKHKLATIPAAPAAAEFLVKFEKVDWAFIFVGPTGILHLSQLWIDQN